MVVAFNWAQYALAGLANEHRDAPRTRVAFDGRFTTCYPESVLDTHFDFILGMIDGQRSRSKSSPPFDPARALTDGQPDLVLIDRKQPHSCQVMRQHADQWTLLYQDRISEVWGRTSSYGDPRSPTYIAPDERWTELTDNSQQQFDPTAGSEPWPAFPYQYLTRDAAKTGEGQTEADEPVRQPVTHPVTAPGTALPSGGA
jgi:hypothetical protein